MSETEKRSHVDSGRGCLVLHYDTCGNSMARLPACIRCAVCKEWIRPEAMGEECEGRWIIGGQEMPTPSGYGPEKSPGRNPPEPVERRPEPPPAPPPVPVPPDEIVPSSIKNGTIEDLLPWHELAVVEQVGVLRRKVARLEGQVKALEKA